MTGDNVTPGPGRARRGFTPMWEPGAWVSGEEAQRRRAELAAELARIDQKVSTLLTLAVAGFGVVLAGLTRPDLPLPGLLAFALAALLAATAVLELLAGIRPSACPPDARCSSAREDAERLAALVDAKYRRLRVAVDALMVAVPCVAAAIAFAL